MTEAFKGKSDKQINTETSETRIRIAPLSLPAPLYDWGARGATKVDGHAHGSFLAVLYQDEQGRLLNPYGSQESQTDKRPLRKEGIKKACDFAVLRPTQKQNDEGNSVTVWQVLSVKHSITKDWVIPGGSLEEDDASHLIGGLRELREETGVTLPLSWKDIQERVQTVFSGPTLSTRATKYKWVETEVNAIVLTEAEGAPLIPTPGDDAEKADWIDLNLLASGRVGEDLVRKSHLLYFQHLASELEKSVNL